MYPFFINKLFKTKTMFQVCIAIPNVGRFKTVFICKGTGILALTPFSILTSSQIQSLSRWVETKFVGTSCVGTMFVQKQKLLNTKRISKVRSGYPTRGHRTRTNKFKFLK